MIRLFLTCLAVVLVSACATPARMEQMTVHIPVAQRSAALKDAVAVADVTGGRETNPLWTSQVSSDEFRRALETSLQNAGMFSRVVAGSRYALTADMTRLDQPLIGFDMTVSATVRYALIETSTRKEVYSRVIQVPYTARLSDSFLGTERLRLANEGAVKANIQALINDLMALPAGH